MCVRVWGARSACGGCGHANSHISIHRAKISGRAKCCCCCCAVGCAQYVTIRAIWLVCNGNVFSRITTKQLELNCANAGNVITEKLQSTLRERCVYARREKIQSRRDLAL